ncbi:MAG: hypothetical protein J6A25_14755 [Lachnospiraceae bacterium]|nr:hypothetical protein [Lachnospiraceae bacterium]
MKNKVISILFIGYIFFFCIGSIIMKDRDFSEMENRSLQQFPELSTKTLLDGSFTEDFEKYMSDQIILKDTLVRIKDHENRLLGQSLINDVYFSEDDMLIKKYNNPYEQLNVNLRYVNEFANLNPELNVTWLVAPNSSYIYEDKLPSYATSYDQGEVMGYLADSKAEEIRFIDCSKPLMEAKEEYIYYNTDHHWTMNGAYIGYKTYCEAVGIEPMEKEDYDIVSGSKEFYGTLYSNAPTFGAKMDEVILFNNPDGEYTVEYMDEGITTNTLYNMDNLEIKDKYTTYLDGNHSILKITSNATAGDNGKLIVVKDSYGHCLIPLLADHYSEIYVVDLRYYHDSVSKLASENDITEILLINNLEFISTDNNFLWLY